MALVRPSNNFRHNQSNYDVERLSTSIFNFHTNYDEKNWGFANGPQLTPVHQSDFKKASPYHDADESKSIVKNAHQQVHTDWLGCEKCIQKRSEIVDGYCNQPADEKAFPDRKASVKLMIEVDIIPNSFPV